MDPIPPHGNPPYGIPPHGSDVPIPWIPCSNPIPIGLPRDPIPWIPCSHPMDPIPWIPCSYPIGLPREPIPWIPYSHPMYPIPIPLALPENPSYGIWTPMFLSHGSHPMDPMFLFFFLFAWPIPCSLPIQTGTTNMVAQKWPRIFTQHKSIKKLGPH